MIAHTFNRKLLSQVQILIAIILCYATMTNAASDSSQTLGFRVGYTGNKSNRNFNQYETYYNLSLPLTWEITSHWEIQTGLSTTMGLLSGNDEEKIVITTGPCFTFHRHGSAVSINVGSSPTLLEDKNFGDYSFGSRIQFTSYLGLSIRCGKHLELGYRFQHMSNARLSERNPGLNLNAFELGYSY